MSDDKPLAVTAGEVRDNVEQRAGAGRFQPTCLDKAANDEPVFILRARDKLAIPLIEMWANSLTMRHGSPAKAQQALAVANRMQEWQDTNGSKLPD